MDATRKTLNTENRRLASWPQDVVRNLRSVGVSLGEGLKAEW